MQAARDAEKRLLEDRKVQARIVDYETKTLLEKAYKRRQEELACKIRLIQELRALERVRTFETKEFDPTECANFGFLCEMSIAELRERLVLVKVEMKEELDRRRQVNVEEKERQRKMIEGTKKFISDVRGSKTKVITSEKIKVEETPDIVALKERLAGAKIARMANAYKVPECTCLPI